MHGIISRGAPIISPLVGINQAQSEVKPYIDTTKAATVSLDREKKKKRKKDSECLPIYRTRA